MAEAVSIFYGLTQESKSKFTATMLHVGLAMINNRPFRHIIIMDQSTSKGALKRLYAKVLKVSKEDLDNIIGMIVKPDNTLHRN